MRISLWLLGTEVLTIELGPSDSPTPEPEHCSLDGGTTYSDRIDPGPTDRFMGFTNGREAEADD